MVHAQPPQANLAEDPSKTGVKIQRPATENVGIFFQFLVLVSILFLGFTGWLLWLEWSNLPLPTFLKNLVVW